MIDILILLILVAIAIGRISPFQMNRTSFAILGSVLLIAFGAINYEDALKSIDLNTLALLFSMMIITANLKLAGFFQYMTKKLTTLSHSPRILLLVIIIISATLSALLINDTIALAMTPLLIELILAVGLKPLPYLIGLALSSNIGSMATIIGNPQNILIGASSGISFGYFTYSLIIPTLLSLIICYLLLLLIFRKDFTRTNIPVPITIQLEKSLLIKTGFSFMLIIAMMTCGWSLTIAALSGASILLISRKIKPDQVFKQIDWSLLVFFATLFIVTKSLEIRPLFAALLENSKPIMANNIPLFALLTAAWSNLISNVPAVMILKNFIPAFPNPDKAYLVLASSSTLAGNLTLLGSMCNLIVAELSERQNIKIGFWSFLKIGFPVTISSLIITTLWLMYT